MFMPRPYPKEFREGERPIAQIAHELGIAEPCLRRWIKQAELDSGQRDDGLSTNERDELRRLRRENARLKQEKALPGEAGHVPEALVSKARTLSGRLARHGCRTWRCPFQPAMAT